MTETKVYNQTGSNTSSVTISTYRGSILTYGSTILASTSNSFKVIVPTNLYVLVPETMINLFVTSDGSGGIPYAFVASIDDVNNTFTVTLANTSTLISIGQVRIGFSF